MTRRRAVLSAAGQRYRAGSTNTLVPTKYMALTGNDSNPGTLASPWRTLQASLPKLVAGDVLGLQPGTYSDGNVFGAVANGTSTNRITVTSVDVNDRAIIDANWRISNVSWWRFNNLRVTNPTPVTDAGVAITDPATDLVRTRVFSITGGTDNIIEDCEIYDSRYAGLLIGRSTTTSAIPHRYTVRRCYIHTTDRVGFYFNVSRYGTGHLIERNIFAHCDSECLKVGWGGSALGPGTDNYETFGAGEVTVRYNTMYDGGDAGVFVVAEPGGLYDVMVYRNIFQSTLTSPNYLVRYDSVEGYLGDKVYVIDNWGYGATQFSQDFDASPVNKSHESGNLYGTNPGLMVDSTWVPTASAAQAYGRYAPVAELLRVSNPNRTEVFDSAGSWRATFTDGARTVAHAGSQRTFSHDDLPILDHFTRTRTAEWATAEYGGKWSQGGGIDADFNVTGTVSTMVCTDANVSRRMRISDYDIQDQNVVVKFKTDKSPAGAGQVAAIMLDYQDVDNYYQCEVTLSSTSSNVLAQIRKRVANVVTTVVAQATVTGLAHSTGAWFWVRAQSLTGGTIRMRVWADGTSEPGTWALSGTDTQFPAGRVGLRAIANTGTTNLPVTFSWDDFSADGTWTQPPTVTHSIWVRVLPAAFTGTFTDANRTWLTSALGDTSLDVLGVAMQYVMGAPAVMAGSLQIAGDADYGPLTSSGGRDEGADFNDYLGIPWTYTGVDNPEPTEFRCLDCSGYTRIVWGYRMGMPLSLTATGSGQLPRVSRDLLDSGPGVVIVPRAVAQITDLTVLRIGDIVGFDATSDLTEFDGEIDHLGIYIGIDTVGNYRFISSRKTPSGPTLSDTGGPSTLNGSGLYARKLRMIRRF